MSLQINKLSFYNLTEEQQESASDNGSGKECANYIQLKYEGKVLVTESDAMEPEDASFNRDLKWIASMVKMAYEVGLIEGKK